MNDVSDALLRLDEDIVDALADNEVLPPGASSSRAPSVIRSVIDDLQERLARSDPTQQDRRVLNGRRIQFWIDDA